MTERKFSECCSIVGVKELCCLDPDRRAIEKAFRRNALKCHPDKGGDPVAFKKLNEAYLKLIGHITKVLIMTLKCIERFKKKIHVNMFSITSPFLASADIY